jgi:hypothetical protein
MNGWCKTRFTSYPEAISSLTLYEFPPVFAGGIFLEDIFGPINEPGTREQTKRPPAKCREPTVAEGVDRVIFYLEMDADSS